MKKIFLALAAFALSASAYSQTEATTKEGKKVILNTDETWKYASATGPSVNDCSLYVKDATSADGRVTVSGKSFIKVPNNGVNGLEILMMKNNGAVSLNFGRLVKDPICVKEGANMTVYLKNGATLKLKHMAKLNCDGDFIVFLGKNLGTDKELATISEAKISKVVIEYSEVDNGKITAMPQEIAFTDAESDKIYQTLKCFETYN